MRVTDLSCFNVHAVWRHFSFLPMTEVERLAMKYVFERVKESLAGKSPAEQSRLTVERTIQKIDYRYMQHTDHYWRFKKTPNSQQHYDALCLAVICRDYMEPERFKIEGVSPDICALAARMIDESEKIEDRAWPKGSEDPMPESFFLAHIGLMEVLQDMNDRLHTFAPPEMQKILSTYLPAIEQYAWLEASIGDDIQSKLKFVGKNILSAQPPDTKPPLRLVQN